MLLINNHRISTPVETILNQLRIETHNEYLETIKHEINGSIMFTCPFHGDHKERRPSCGIISSDSSDATGVYHCFACGRKGFITDIIQECLDISANDAVEWVMQRCNFEMLNDDNLIQLEPIEFNKDVLVSEDESILNTFEYSNRRALDYLTIRRKLQLSVINYFRIGYDRATDSITFPVWNDSGKFVGVLRRSISNKRFAIPENFQKPVYLLNTIKEFNYTTAYVVESQINALTLYGWNRPAVALFGTGSNEQYNILQRSGVRHWILCFDGDKAGKNATKRFVDRFSYDSIVDVINIPDGKDVNDLTINEFIKLEKDCLNV